MDSTWERTLYVSLIDRIELKYAVSDQMVAAKTPIDSSGRFELALDQFPEEWVLVRLHLVKKGDPPASLIIGSSDENFCFLVINRHTKLELHNSRQAPIFHELNLKGSTHSITLRYIENLVAFPNSISYEAMIEKEFMEEVVKEKLKVIADTCTNPLVSLYALYQIDFWADYQTDQDYYQQYLARWDRVRGPYFGSFRRQFPVQRPNWNYFIGILLVLSLLAIGLVLFLRKGRRLKKLSIQERKVLELIKKGASNQEISDEFHIELSTVKSHVSSILAKLKVKSRKEIVKMK